MSDSESGKLNEMSSRIKDVVAGAGTHLDASGFMHRVRETIGKVGRTVDTEAIGGRVKEVTGEVEGKIDTDKLRQSAGDVDGGKIKGLLDEAQHLGASAAVLVGTQGAKLADRAPGALEKLAGTAKARLGTLAGDEGLISEEQLERFKGQIKETIASVTEMGENRSKDAAETIKSKLDEESRRR